MTIFKKTLAILIIAVMFTGALFGCNTEPTDVNNSGTSGIQSSDDGMSTDSSSDAETSTEASTDESTDTSEAESAVTSEIESAANSEGNSGTSSASISKDTAILYPGRVMNLGGRTIILNYPKQVPLKPLDGIARFLRKLEAIEKAYNCNIVFDNTISESNKNTTIKASVLAGKPSVDIWYQNGFVTEFLPHYTQGLLQPLDNLKVIDFKDREKYSESTELVKINGKYYGVCFADYGIVGANVMFFNKKYLEDCGITDDLYDVQNSGQWTWDKFASYCKIISQQPGKTALFDSDGMLYNQIMYSYGTDYIIRDAQGNATFGGGTTAGLAALNYYTDLVKNKYIVTPNPATEGGTYYSGFWGVGDATRSFLEGEAAFASTEYLMMEYGIKASGYDIVKANYGMLFQPKKNASDPYAAYSDATLCGFFSIPYGVKKPAEVATIMDAIQGDSPNKAEAADDDANEVALRTEAYAAQYAGALNSVTGDDMVELKFKLVDMYVEKKFVYKFSFLGNGPGISKDWISHVSKIANSSENAGTVISSVTNNYNSKLKDLFVIR